MKISKAIVDDLDEMYIENDIVAVFLKESAGGEIIKGRIDTIRPDGEIVLDVSDKYRSGHREIAVDMIDYLMRVEE